MDQAIQYSATSTPHFYFADVLWLGGTHDGFPLLPTQDYIKERKARHPDLPHTACQLQSLLIFGVLEAALGLKISESQLLCTDTLTGTTVVTQGGMSALLEAWRQRTLQIRSWEAASHWVYGVKKAVVGGSIMFEMAIDRHAFQKLPEAADPLVAAQLYAQAASILDVVYTTATFIIANWSSEWQLLTIPAPRFGAYITSLRPMINKMVGEGWCPFTLAILSEHPILLSYASSHPLDHSSARGHSTCSPTSCATNNIDTSNYQPVHVSTDCTCTFIKPDLDTVLAALTADMVPVVQLSLDGDHIITSTSSQTPFVALSHVWADGLGSTTEAGLPQCQLHRIAALVQHLTPGGAFWMDSLCVPAAREQRKKAIALMARTYHDASHVLVLDAQIREVSRTVGCVEKLFRIVTSGWMQRLWTLQEGVLAQQLLFEFAGGPVDIERLEDPTEMTAECLANPVWAYLTDKLARLRYYRSQAATPHVSFTLADVFLSLRWRATSRPSDETLAVAGLLDVDAGVLASLSPEDRMPHLLLQLRSVDDSLPFSNTPRLTTPGFRWAPSTMMCHIPAKIGSASRPRAVCTNAGLLAEYFTFCFDEVELGTGGSAAPPFICIQDTASKAGYFAMLSNTKDAEEMTWPCNVLLFAHDHLGGHATSSIAAFRYGVEDEGGEARHLCTYQAHLMVKDMLSQFGRPSLPPEIPVARGTLKKARVRLD